MLLYFITSGRMVVPAVLVLSSAMTSLRPPFCKCFVDHQSLGKLTKVPMENIHINKHTVIHEIRRGFTSLLKSRHQIQKPCGQKAGLRSLWGLGGIISLFVVLVWMSQFFWLLFTGLFK